jgi:hypothetical protein
MTKGGSMSATLSSGFDTNKKQQVTSELDFFCKAKSSAKIETKATRHELSPKEIHSLPAVDLRTGPSGSRHAITRAGTLQLSCNGIILNDLRIKNADAGAESTSNSSKLGRQTGNALFSFPKIICLKSRICL